VEFLELWDLEFQLLGGDEMSAWLLAVLFLLLLFFFFKKKMLLALFQLHSLPACLEYMKILCSLCDSVCVVWPQAQI